MIKMQRVKQEIKRQLAKSQVTLNGIYAGVPGGRVFDSRVDMRLLRVPVHIA